MSGTFMSIDFIKRLDDVIRQEISLLGYEYNDPIVSIGENPGGDGARVRVHPPYEDVWFDEPPEDVSDEQLAAKVHRRLAAAIEAPTRAAAPPDSV